ncbi:MAG: T9SS type A sorting domain-containing protein [Sporocytophaga sp.]|uniref:T9SS type A sorting domain-containing protein n=1 Tax=Sporocytophaga sp. TaxID=2231183 RepID=UPI001B0192E3|nr:T9SS type A sorting domain-containing protein [Sporocytophaga sp.]MBO9702388.1 T9SS type A sorting domain-containing protein [Sporocytophaga sp.]
MKRILLLVVFLLNMVAVESFATHIKGGQILYQIIGDKASVALITYTNRSAVDAGVDDPTASIDFGDGTSSEYPRSSKRLINDDTYENVYMGEQHRFPGTGTYKIGYTESNRTGDIKNMSNSINTPYYVETLVSIVSGSQTTYSGPLFLSAPIFQAEKNKTFTNNISAYVQNGDSLAYKLVSCKQARNVDVSNYFIPNGFKIDPYSGQITWDNPSIEGRYNFAVMVELYRSGVRIGYVIRDFQIYVNKDQLSGQKFDITSSHSLTPGNSISLDPGNVFSMEVFFQDTANSIANLKYFGELQNEDGVFNITIEQANASARETSTALKSPLYKATVTMNVEEKHKRSMPYNLIFRGETKGSSATISNDLTIQLYIGVPVPLGINSKSAKSKANLSLYPVPVTDRFTIKKESNVSGTLIIYDIEGKDVKRIYLSNGALETQYSIELQSGTYMYNFNSDNGEEFSTGKFLVN